MMRFSPRLTPYHGLLIPAGVYMVPCLQTFCLHAAALLMIKILDVHCSVSIQRRTKLSASVQNLALIHHGQLEVWRP